jgi:hypothetical protein
MFKIRTVVASELLSKARIGVVSRSKPKWQVSDLARYLRTEYSVCKRIKWFRGLKIKWPLSFSQN